MFKKLALAATFAVAAILSGSAYAGNAAQAEAVATASVYANNCGKPIPPKALILLGSIMADHKYTDRELDVALVDAKALFASAPNSAWCAKGTKIFQEISQ